ncbi:MAG: hypothetical protein IJX16_01220 [Clostridia bacterium]|nr:hypothetical protein [Clostridia bacterium]
MKCSIIKKAKIFFISALVVLVLGLTLFSIFGFNQTVDYKASYEVQVSVEQKAGNVVDVMNDATNKYFNENGIKPLNFATQSIDDGMMIIYKFDCDVTESVSGLKSAIQTAIDSDSTVQGVLADVSVKEVLAKDNINVGRVVLALAIAVVVTFVIALIFEKLASAVAVAFSTVLSAVLFIAFMGITRIPAAPFVAIGGAISVILAGVISAITLNRYKVEYKKADKATNAQIVDKIANKSKKLYILISSAVLLVSVALCAFGLPYIMIAGAQIVIAGISGISSAVFGTPFMWALIKKNK